MLPKVEAFATKQKEKALKRCLLNELAGLHLASVRVWVSDGGEHSEKLVARKWSNCSYSILDNHSVSETHQKY